MLEKGGVPDEGLDERAAGTGLAHAAWVFAGHAAVFVRLRRLVAHRRQGLAWVMAPALVLGLGAAAASFWGFYCYVQRRNKPDKKGPAAFNDHV